MASSLPKLSNFPYRYQTLSYPVIVSFDVPRLYYSTFVLYYTLLNHAGLIIEQAMIVTI
jgi:hypothetical protein